MNISEMFDSTLVRALGWALLHLLWQGTAVGLLLAGLLALLRRQAPAVRYVVSCGALVLVTALPAVTVWNSYRSEIRPGGADSEQSSSGTPTGSFPLLELQAPTMAVQTGNGAAPPQSSYHEFPSLLERYLPLIVGLWLFGVFCASSKLTFAWLKLRRLAIQSVPASPEWQHALVRLTRRIRLSTPVRLLESRAVEVPTVIGWIRPVILLPITALTGLSRQQLETIMAHELAHIRRHDFLVNLLQTAVETLFFYHPAVWWISSQIRIEREHCCDDLAVEICGNPLLYARALAELEQTRFPSPLPAVALNGGTLLQRVRRLISDSPRRCSAQWLAGVSVMTLVAGLALAAPLSLLAIHDQDEPSAAASTSIAPVPAQTSITVQAPRADEDDCAVHEEDDCEIHGEETHVQVHGDSEHTAHPVHATALIHQAAKAASATSTVYATVADVTARLLPVSAQLAPVLSHNLGNVFAYALAGPATAKVPRPLLTPAVAVAPRGLFLAAPQVPLLADAPDVEDLEFDFDHDFDFDFDFDFDYDFDFGEDHDQAEKTATRDKKAEKTDRDKPLNRSALTVDDLIHLKSLGITAQYVEEMEKAGFPGLSVRELGRLAAAGVRGSDVAQYKDLGIANLDVRELARLKAAGVSSDYVRQLREAGYTGLTSRDLMRLAASGVNPRFIAEANALAARKLTPRELIRMKNLGIDKKYVEELHRNGFTKLSPEELMRWKSLGVSPEFVKEMKEAGFANLSTGEIVALRSAGVTGQFVRSLREVGLTNLKPMDVVKLRHAGVDAAFIKQMKKQGN